MPLARREFIAGTSAALATGAFATVAETARAEAVAPEAIQPAPPSGSGDEAWREVRAAFALSRDSIHMSAMLVASHPRPVRDAIEHHRRGLDADPVAYLETNDRRFKQAVREAAGDYLGTGPSNIALTDSTTMGVGLVYNALRLSPDQEILTTDTDYYVTHESLRVAAKRSGASVRQISLHDGAADATADGIVGRIADAIRPETRVLAVTWVHSSTGLKLPLREISEALAEINADRDEEDQVLFCVDSVHGFGVEDATLDELGCDFMMSGCHKWLFGPRGTGIVAGTSRGWRALRPIIPSFLDGAPYQAWLAGAEDPAGPTTAARMTPGGFKPFEHEWAVREAFGFLQDIGKERVAARTHALARQLKEGLTETSGIALETPMDDALSAGIVAFHTDRFAPAQMVARLRNRGVIASVAPYATPRVRLTPCIYNSRAEIETVLSEIRAILG